MKKIKSMYFSGTGTTEKVLRFLAEETAKQGGYEFAEHIDFTPKEARAENYSFDDEDLVFLGVPVIAGRVPNVLLKFLATLEGGGAMGIPIVLYGNRNFDDALIELRNIMEERGFRTVAAAAFIGEHSFSRILAAGRPDASDMERCRAFAGDVASKIKGIEAAGSGEEHAAIDVEGETPLRNYYQPQDRNGNPINILKVKPKLDETKCTKCGICVTACPMGSIKPEAPGVVDGICIKCCGCEKKCPEGALYFDDEGYLYHKEELEFLYADKRREPSLFI